MRSDRVHVDEPRTPPFSKDRIKEHEPELELDLESLGLEDREIPYEKLTKMEKIGSGGFKDVFIGKLKGKKIAIAEFRGQLSASMFSRVPLVYACNADRSLSSGHQGTQIVGRIQPPQHSSIRKYCMVVSYEFTI